MQIRVKCREFSAFNSLLLFLRQPNHTIWIRINANIGLIIIIIFFLLSTTKRALRVGDWHTGMSRQSSVVSSIHLRTWVNAKVDERLDITVPCQPVKFLVPLLEAKQEPWQGSVRVVEQTNDACGLGSTI